MDNESTKELVIIKVRNFFEKRLTDSDEIKSVHFKNMNLLNGTIGIPVTCEYTHKAKTGRVTTKKDEILIYPPYDPFTGKKRETDG